MTHAGRTIRAVRSGLGLSLNQLAREAQVNASYLSKVERGLEEPSDRWMRDVKEVLARHMSERGAA